MKDPRFEPMQEMLRAVTRRHFFRQAGFGIGSAALAALLNRDLFAAGAQGAASAVNAVNPLAVRPPHFPAKAKSIIYLFMAGAPSQLDLLDFKPKLQQLERDVRAGKVRTETTIVERVTRILVEAKATPYIDYEAAPGDFAWREKTAKLEAMQRDAGRYVLQSNQLDLQAEEAVTAYRQLEVVEDSFRHLKDTLHLRPVYHRNPQRVLGHIGLCVLGLFLLRLLEQQLLAAGLCQPARRALAAVQQLQAVPIYLAHRELWPLPYVPATAAAVLRALGVADPKARFKADLRALEELPADSS